MKNGYILIVINFTKNKNKKEAFTMAVLDILKKDIMILNLKAKTKDEALKEMSNSLFENGLISNK